MEDDSHLSPTHASKGAIDGGGGVPVFTPTPSTIGTFKQLMYQEAAYAFLVAR